MSSKRLRKICSCCRRNLPLDRYGYRSCDKREHYYCRECRSMKQKEYVQSLPEARFQALRASQRAWRDAHPEKVKEYNRVHNRKRPARRKNEQAVPHF